MVYAWGVSTTTVSPYSFQIHAFTHSFSLYIYTNKYYTLTIVIHLDGFADFLDPFWDGQDHYDPQQLEATKRLRQLRDEIPPSDTPHDVKHNREVFIPRCIYDYNLESHRSFLHESFIFLSKFQNLAVMDLD